MLRLKSVVDKVTLPDDVPPSTVPLYILLVVIDQPLAPPIRPEFATISPLKYAFPSASIEKFLDLIKPEFYKLNHVPVSEYIGGISTISAAFVSDVVQYS